MKSVSVVIVGVGAVGCELLYLLMDTFQEHHFHIKQLALVDADVVSESNLSRQCLFGDEDVGRQKVLVAEEWIRKRYPTLSVLPMCCRIEDVHLDLLRQFDVFFSAVDSLLCRRYINYVVSPIVLEAPSFDANAPLSLQEKNDSAIELQADCQETIRNPNALAQRNPVLVECGIEGWMGHTRLVVFGISACIECTKDLYMEDHQLSNQIPLCSVPGITLTAKDCLSFALATVDPDPDQQVFIDAIFQAARQRADKFQINLIELQSLLDAWKDQEFRFIPAINTTVVFIAAKALQLLCRYFDDAPTDHSLLDFWFYNAKGHHHRPLLYNCPISPSDDCSVCALIRFSL